MIIYGAVDHRGRPYIRVETPDGHSFLLHVDTGVNGMLVVNRHALYRLGGKQTVLKDKTIQNIQLADLSIVEAFVGQVELMWFGRAMLVEILVTTFIPEVPPREDEPVGLIGTKMFKECRLVIDYLEKTVEIHRL